MKKLSYLVEYDQGHTWHPWTVMARFEPVTWLERWLARRGWRREQWLQVFSAASAAEASLWLEDQLCRR